MNIETLLKSGANVAITVTPADLKEFAVSLINETMRINAVQGNQDNCLSRKEVTEKLHVSEGTLWRWERNGYLSPLKIGGRVLYRATDIETLLKAKA